MTSSESSSSSSERESTPTPRKSKDKGKKKAVHSSNDSAKNEGPDPNWEYKPPPGVTLLQDATDAGDFDYDEVAKNDDLEVWLIRVPDSVKAKYLDHSTFNNLGSVNKSSQVGILNRKVATFDIWSVGEDADVGGDEIKTLSCLLPRKSKKGKLYPAPKPIARHLVISAQAIEPTKDASSSGSIQPYSRPPRESYPKEALKHTFQPYGSRSDAQPAEEDEMNVDSVTEPPVPSSPKVYKSKHAKANSPEVDKKGKKRKGEEVASTPAEKKSKKVKTS